MKIVMISPARGPDPTSHAAGRLGHEGTRRAAVGARHVACDTPYNISVRIEIDDLSRPEIHALLNEHLQSMYELSPPESVHALDLENLRKPGITFWSAWKARSCWVAVPSRSWTASTAK